jgi:CBS domain-containing protein
MVDRKFHTLPVTRGDLLVGIVGMQDIIKTLMPRS